MKYTTNFDANKEKLFSTGLGGKLKTWSLELEITQIQEIEVILNIRLLPSQLFTFTDNTNELFLNDSNGSFTIRNTINQSSLRIEPYQLKSQQMIDIIDANQSQISLLSPEGIIEIPRGLPLLHENLCDKIREQ